LPGAGRRGRESRRRTAGRGLRPAPGAVRLL